jgi:hypothetical protein
MHPHRSHTCGALRSADTGQNVRLSGWIHRKRDHGGLMFIDLRDHYGLTQLVISPETPGFDRVERLRAESVIRVDGQVLARSADTINPNLPTGEVEIRVSSIDVISEAAELPLPVFGEPDYPEDMRLKHRYLDLRRETLHKNIVLRSKVIHSIRPHDRPGLPGVPDADPDGLVAGRRARLPGALAHAPGKFYALPQAPQQFKQLLMVSGFDRYFQIAPCFRDEDLRADRSLEFYQLDVEMSFVTQDDVFAAIEPVMHGVFEEFADGKSVDALSVPAHPLRDSIAWYGTDKPDLRNPIKMPTSPTQLPRRRLWPVRPDPGRRQERRLGDPRAEGRQPRLLRPHELLGPGRGPARPRLHLLERGPGRLGRPDRQEPRRRATEALMAARPGPGRRGLLRRRRSQDLLQVRRLGPHQGRDRAGPDRRGPLRVLLDRRLPDVRDGTRREEGRLLAQPLLDAAGRAGGPGDPGPAGHPGLPVRHRLQRLRAVLGRDPQPLPEIMLKAFEIAGYDARGRRGPVRRHAERLPLWRAAARRPGPRHRPHRHAAGRRDRHPRGHRLPAEPAGAGSVDERAVRGQDKQLKELHIRLAPPIKVSRHQA